MPKMALISWDIKSVTFFWKKRAAVYTTTAPNDANLFIKNLLTLTNTFFNTPKVAY